MTQEQKTTFGQEKPEQKVLPVYKLSVKKKNLPTFYLRPLVVKNASSWVFGKKQKSPRGCSKDIIYQNGLTDFVKKFCEIIGIILISETNSNHK